MSDILHITASIRDADSITRRLGGQLVDALSARAGRKVVTRNLSANDLPLIDAERFAANLTPAGERSEEQQRLAAIADELISELRAAETVVFSLPLYNFSMPSTLKAWADLVARAGTTFRYTENGPEGLLTGKKAYVVVASGGTQVGSAIDFLTPWLRHFLGFLGIADVEIVAADGLMGADAQEKITAAERSIQRIAA